MFVINAKIDNIFLISVPDTSVFQHCNEINLVVNFDEFPFFINHLQKKFLNKEQLTYVDEFNRFLFFLKSFSITKTNLSSDCRVEDITAGDDADLFGYEKLLSQVPLEEKLNFIDSHAYGTLYIYHIKKHLTLCEGTEKVPLD